MIEHVRAWADEHGFELHQDAGRNLVIRVPATAGRESAPVLMLQGHLDMVCERQPDSPNDPAEGRIELIRDGDWLTADGTTLGADDGVAIAAMMALAEDASLPHGPLELLMTVAEEVGLEGRERGGRVAPLRNDSHEPRQRGGRHPDGRLRRQHRHVDPDRRTACPGASPTRRRSRSSAAAGSEATPESRSPSGARTRSRCSAGCSVRRIRRRAVPPRLARRRQEPKRDPA